MRTKGGAPRVIATAMWGRDEAENPGTSRCLEPTDPSIHDIRGRIEKIFGA
ncbi:hypothetical protein OLZ32_32590 [Rhizobium sp. 1AS11]|uniref:hypothetical protein n=1 Tax=Rhizobium acaciae TaxID=2989736 RepID=UPI002222F583|nr:hypothetical protein [Rhizobium acaciae]MCW1412957.1 hypothetical protein [Rhizobium acaciae]MCW1745109.1 hypothetical protein [Rhizobium acaciae]